jgi:hypothetical protein
MVPWYTGSSVAEAAPAPMGRMTLLIAGTTLLVGVQQARPQDAAPAHSLSSATRSLSFVLNAPVDECLAAFGPVEEQKWDPDFSPHFIVRTGPEGDPDYAVFATESAAGPATWVLSQHDRSMHSMQYVSVRPNLLVTVIDIHCVQADAARSRATVMYHRTALASDSNQLVEDFAHHFESQKTHWRDAMNAYFAKRAGGSL